MKPPSRAVLGEVLGGTVLRVTELEGGVSCSVHSVRLQRPDGTRDNVVVRRYGADWQAKAPEVSQREFNVLEVLTQRGFPAPRPLLLDKTGARLGMPSIVISRLPGRGVLVPRDLDGFLQQMTNVLVMLHQQPPVYACTHALRYMHEWAAGYQALGRPDLTAEVATQRVADYARQLLARVDH